MNDSSNENAMFKLIRVLAWVAAVAVVALVIGFFLLYFPPKQTPQKSPAPAPPASSGSTEIVPSSDAFFASSRFALDSLADDANGRAIRYGHALISETPAYLGPAAKDAHLRYAGNNLSCQNCHLQAGQKPFAAPFVGISGQYPTYKGRENDISTLEERINGCMERSMDGKPLPLDSKEMEAMVMYINWLSRGVASGQELQGQGFAPLAAPDRAADLVQGKAVYVQKCAVCHGKEGQGQHNDGAGYLYPPLWGPDSYNDGAGMHRLLTAARFIKANMPFGATADSPQLTDAEAYDVAAYINSMPRPAKAHKEKDYPDLSKKPVDCPYPPYADDFPMKQHQLGPFQPIEQARAGKPKE